jgi:hypothetical protein
MRESTIATHTAVEMMRWCSFHSPISSCYGGADDVALQVKLYKEQGSLRDTSDIGGQHIPRTRFLWPLSPSNRLPHPTPQPSKKLQPRQA